MNSHVCCCLVILIFLTGCSINQMKVEQSALQLQNGNIDAAISNLEDFQPAEHDKAFIALNLGLLKFNAGDYNGSITALEIAKNEITALQASSITENVEAASINETLRAYVGSPSERVLVHFYLALCYLGLNDFSGARVEILQANVLLKEPAYENSLSGQLASVHLLSAIIFEMNAELSNAMISYRKALSIMRERKQSLPEVLKIGLIRMSSSLGLKAEYEKYKTEFNLSTKDFDRKKSSLFVIYANGLSSPKKEHKLTSFNDELSQQISFAIPHYDPIEELIAPDKVTMTFENTQIPLESVENINLLLREDLEQEIDGIRLMTMARALVKARIAHEARVQSDGLGLITNIAAHLSEIADLRTWRILPAQILISRLQVSTDTPQVRQVIFNQRQPIDVTPGRARSILLMTQDYSNKYVLFKQ